MNILVLGGTQFVGRAFVEAALLLVSHDLEVLAGFEEVHDFHRLNKAT